MSALKKFLKRWFFNFIWGLCLISALAIALALLVGTLVRSTTGLGVTILVALCLYVGRAAREGH